MFRKPEPITHGYLLSLGFNYIKRKSTWLYSKIAEYGAVIELRAYDDPKEDDFKYWWTINGQLCPEGLYEKDSPKLELTLKTN